MGRLKDTLIPGDYAMKDESGYDWNKDIDDSDFDTNAQICSICGGVYHGYGNNAEPVNSGRCCDTCNGIVLGRRLENLRNGRPRDHRG